jgi:ABC-2 type transport system ATP-binding protein
MSELVTARNLHKHFGNVRAVDGVSLTVSEGEIYGLVGSDGAGKTTTMRLIVGALSMDQGECVVVGRDVARHPDLARAELGYLSQRFSLYEELTVLENIRFFAEVRGLRPDEWLPRCMEILDFVGLSAFKDRRAGQLSGGMRQKLGLASALVTRPQVLLLDEPTTGVDPVTRQDFWQLLISLVSADSDPAAEDGRTRTEAGAAPRPAVLISTPYMDEAARCHRVGFMRHGRIIAEDTPSRLRAMLSGRIIELKGAPSPLIRQAAEALSEIEAVRAFGDRLHVRVAGGHTENVLLALKKAIAKAGAELSYIRQVPPLLEDVFIFLSEQAYE